MNKKMIASLMAIVLMTSTSVYGATGKVVQAKSQNDKVQEVQVSQEDEIQATSNDINKEKKVLTLNEAIEKGLQDSLLLQQVKNQEKLAHLVASNASTIKDTLVDSENALEDASYLIDDGRDQVYSSEAQLRSAQARLDNGCAPTAIPVNKPEFSLNTTIPEGAEIYSFLVSYYEGLGLPTATAQGYASQITPAVIKSAQNVLNQNLDALNGSKKKLEASTQEYLSSKSKYDAALQFAMANVANKLSTSTISSLKTKPLGDLVVKMALAQDEVTSYSQNIFKNKAALLIENSYFEALKQQKLLEVKDKAVERGAVQYEMAKAAYEVGAKSKDDLIIAKTYYDSTLMSRELQLKDYNAALIELKKNINMKLDEYLVLQEVEPNIHEEFELAKGIESGLKARLEIRMATTQQKLYEDLLDAVSKSEYSSSDAQYKEVKLLQDKAQIELNSAKLQVESDIRTSYSTMVSMEKIVEKANELVASAKETVELAKVKYEVGYGYDNALLKQLNLEDLSGTLTEVIAAEENLTNIQEKQIEAINGYNLAKLKYLNDVGILPYK